MMLKPNRYTDIALSVVGLSAEILLQLKYNPTQKYNQLLSHITGKLGEESKQNFLLALVFLFSLGKIEYHKKEDVIELVTVSKLVAR